MCCIFPYRTKMNTICIFSHDCPKLSTAQISVQLTDMTDEHKTRRRSVNISLPSSPAIQHTSQVRGGGGPRVVVSTAAFHARARGSVPDLCGLIETKMFLPHSRVKFSIVGSLRDRELACSVSDRQGSNFESCVWRTVSSHSSHHLQEVFLAQFSL